MPDLGRTTASLRISGDDLDPDTITRLLGSEPTAWARTGDVHRTQSGRDVVARSGSWRLSAGSACPGDLNGQIATILAKLTDDLSVWRNLSRLYRCDVFCGLFMRAGNEGAHLDSGILTMLGARGLRLDLDIYGPP